MEKKLLPYVFTTLYISCVIVHPCEGSFSRSFSEARRFGGSAAIYLGRGVFCGINKLHKDIISTPHGTFSIIL